MRLYILYIGAAVHDPVLREMSQNVADFPSVVFGCWQHKKWCFLISIAQASGWHLMGTADTRALYVALVSIVIFYLFVLDFFFFRTSVHSVIGRMSECLWKCSMFISVWLCLMESAVLRHHWDAGVVGTFSDLRHSRPLVGLPDRCPFGHAVPLEALRAALKHPTSVHQSVVFSSAHGLVENEHPSPAGCSCGI